MPRYFFHLRSPSGDFVRDEEGVELSDLDSAAREAALTARSFDRDRPRGGTTTRAGPFKSGATADRSTCQLL